MSLSQFCYHPPFLLLSFFPPLPAQFIDPKVDLKPLLPVLARVFDAALEGGGAKAFNFQALAGDLAQITFDYPFRIPPYFALIIRAIGVLEGIALVGDPGFALVCVCLQQRALSIHATTNH